MSGYPFTEEVIRMREYSDHSLEDLPTSPFYRQFLMITTITRQFPVDVVTAENFVVFWKVHLIFIVDKQVEYALVELFCW